MPELTPLDDNRQEHFLNGEDLEPITRREHFYAGRESELPAGHQEPETREEWFIQKYRGGGGDVTVVPLSVTENGTYSEEGKAYSPVSVNVPLPQNAYLLKSVANLPAPIASFNDGEDMVMPTLKVAIEPQQEGSGDPSPTNIRPISGWSAVNVARCGKNLWNNNWSAYTQPSDYRICPIKLENGQYTASVKLKEGGTRQSGFTLGIAKQGDRYSNFGSFYTASTGADKTETITVDDAWTSPKLIIYCSNETAFNDIFDNYEIQLEEGTTPTTYEPYAGTTYTIDLGGTRYGGYIDWENDCLVIDKKIYQVTNDTIIGISGTYFEIQNVLDEDATANYEFISSFCKRTTASLSSMEVNTGRFVSGRRYFAVNLDYETIEQAKTALVNMGAQIVYDLPTPITIPLQLPQVKSLRGVNNVWADTGDIKDAEYFSKEV